jgi:hypothetical protein
MQPDSPTVVAAASPARAVKRSAIDVGGMTPAKFQRTQFFQSIANT